MSEPPRKIAKYSTATGPLTLNSGAGEEPVKFYITLCFDVILEVLQFGDRRQLIKLQRIGQRFHRIGENFFAEVPFLRLDLMFEFDQMSQRLQAFLRSGTPLKHISNVDLAAFPKFLRFKDVELSYNYFFSEGSIEKKCELFQKHLQQLSPALNDSNLIVFDAYINKGHQHYFSSHLQLVDHLRQQLLPICDSSRGYTFEICFYSGKSEASAVIESILQLPQIEHCSHVELVLCYANPTALPVQAIAEWLNRECNRTGVTGPKCKEKFLKISLDWIQNLVEMCGHLTEEFKEAKVPTTQFKFLLESYDVVNDLEAPQMLINGKSNEVLSVRKKHYPDRGEDNYEYKLEIKRAAKKKDS